MRCYAILLVLAIVCSAVLAHHGNDPYRPNHMNTYHKSRSSSDSRSHERSRFPPRGRFPHKHHSRSSSDSREHRRPISYPKKPAYVPSKY